MLAYKVVIVGDFGVGKTSLIRRFVDNSFSEEYLSTIGVSISKKKLDQSMIMLWDIEGQTEYKPIAKQYLAGAKAFIIVADLCRVDTINSIEKHIDLCLSTVNNAPICIALNKSDLMPQLDDTILERFIGLSPNIIKIIKTSAKENIEVDTLFITLDQHIKDGLKS